MISILVPVYNSEKTLKPFVERVTKAMNKHHYQYEILLVNDGSHDGSTTIMRKLLKEYPAVTCIDLKGNFGQQNALLCGMRYGRGTVYITIDDDLQYQPEDIPKLVRMLYQKNYDVIYGIPFDKKHSVFRNLGTVMTDLLLTFLLKKPIHKKVSSFRAMKKEIVVKIVKDRNSKVYLSAATLLHTKNIGNVFVCHKSRREGKSNYDIAKLFRLYMNILIYYGNIPILRKRKKKAAQYIVNEVMK